MKYFSMPLPTAGKSRQRWLALTLKSRPSTPQSNVLSAWRSLKLSTKVIEKLLKKYPRSDVNHASDNNNKEENPTCLQIQWRTSLESVSQIMMIAQRAKHRMSRHVWSTVLGILQRSSGSWGTRKLNTVTIQRMMAALQLKTLSLKRHL